MFHYDRGLKLTAADLAVDARRRQPRGFISHAHTDHMARHELALCTPATARFYHARLGTRPVEELPFGTPVGCGPLTLVTHPAGHCLGSAMLWAHDGSESLLYTGDFKLGESATSEMAAPPRADILVMESTYGEPQYRHRPRAALVAELVERVAAALAAGSTPVIQAYVLGKAQEVTRLLTTAGIPVLQHPTIFALSRVYGECGVDLGEHHEYPGYPRPGHAVIVPPVMHRAVHLAGLKRVTRIAVTGWAGNARFMSRWGVDHVIGLSDHADFDQLLELVEQVSPRVVYCTHGPASFVDELRRRGWHAHVLGPTTAGSPA